MRLYSLLVVFVLPSLLFSQTVQIELPYYAGRDYYFCLLRGTKQDTIFTGTLDVRGRTVLDVSKHFLSYQGVGRFSVAEYGKIWNIVLNRNENFSMSEPDKLEADPYFAGSVENSFLLDALAGKKSNKEIADSHLYAARIFEILTCLAGNDPAEQHSFITDKLDFEDLYSSGFWQLTFDVWYQTAREKDTLLISSAKKILDRTTDIPLRRELTQSIIRLFSKYGKDALLAELGTEYLTMPLNGQLAPNIIAGGSSFLPESCLIVFYETGCGNCHYELESLKNKYQLLMDNKIRIISISADMDKDVFEETSKGLPWEDNICDFKGFDGVNFENYGIVGTPTFILTDRVGIVRGRYAQLKELLR